MASQVLNPITNETSLSNNRLLTGHHVEYDVLGGFCYLWCLWSSVSMGAMTPCICCPYQFMKTQSVTLDESRIRYKVDSFLINSDKLIPFDRIQDVNINENCMHRCCCISEIQIQTAGGGNIPEMTIIAPRNAQELRDNIMKARDEFVYREMAHFQKSTPSTGHSVEAANEEEIGLLVQTLKRIESKMIDANERL